MGLHLLLLPALAALLLVACQKPEPDARARQFAAHAAPADATLAQVYQRSCQACHAQATSTAPLVGYAPHWEARLNQGMPTLLAHVRQGLGAMPPMGFCADCSDTTLVSLINFMSTPQPAAVTPP